MAFFAAVSWRQGFFVSVPRRTLLVAQETPDKRLAPPTEEATVDQELEENTEEAPSSSSKSLPAFSGL